MNNPELLGPWLRRFLLEHLTTQRNMSRNTQRSYRDTLVLLLTFLSGKQVGPLDRLTLARIDVQMVFQFLDHLETDRHCSIMTRNQRLAALHALARFISFNSPEHVMWSGQIRAIPFKRFSQPTVSYLEKEEIDALLAAPDLATLQGRRDYALLLFLYNTGARAAEAASLRVGDLDLPVSASVSLLGKGSKSRICPLWPVTVKTLMAAIGNRPVNQHVFLNRCGHPITRFGIHSMVKRYGKKVSHGRPSLAVKRISPHTIRHTTAVHLLRAGVDINTIRAWLGHASLDTTNIYAEIDLQMKADALARCEIKVEDGQQGSSSKEQELMTFLHSL
jgi:site-specific recombinase XerD